jgi:membrane protein implicated in regulation of membrane protease activity
VTLREHAILGGGAAVALSPIIGPQDSLVFFGASVLIDVDHYWDYLYRNRFRDWSPRRMFAFHRVLFSRVREPGFLALNLFHTLEWFAVVSFGAAWLGWSALGAVLAGMVFHLFLDVVRLAQFRAAFARAFSVVEYVIRRRLLERRGLDPDKVYEQTLAEIGVAPVAFAEDAQRDLPS